MNIEVAIEPRLSLARSEPSEPRTRRTPLGMSFLGGSVGGKLGGRFGTGRLTCEKS